MSNAPSSCCVPTKINISHLLPWTCPDRDGCARHTKKQCTTWKPLEDVIWAWFIIEFPPNPNMFTFFRRLSVPTHIQWKEIKKNISSGSQKCHHKKQKSPRGSRLFASFGLDINQRVEWNVSHGLSSERWDDDKPVKTYQKPEKNGLPPASRCIIFSGTGGKSRPGDVRCRVNDESRMGCGETITPPKFNSKFAPENLPKPNRKPRIVFLSPPFFRGKLAVKLQGCILMLKWEWARVT